ncbi:MAG: accessory factor UbiK family protein [Casimicrobiaceae bacterium]|nr:accessory factor UbiK family protein [Casimicrobiaceae bacterium]MCX8098105.1 accessory factor UbiK family protein [Casimicrobiaceae bacterium]MDW8311643.1 accessory factor UbiK family protein [Burkholderiales bacterium]
MTLDDLVNQLREVFASDPGADLQKNLRAVLEAGLARMDLVTRQEFELQRALLEALREQVDALTRQVAELERARALGQGTTKP